MQIKFRNYTPQTEELKAYVEPKPVVPTVEDEVKKFARTEQDLARAHEVVCPCPHRAPATATP